MPRTRKKTPSTAIPLFDENEEITGDGIKLNKKLSKYFERLFKQYKDYRTKDVFILVIQAASFARSLQFLMNKCKRVEGRKK